ncbi:Mitochondrial carrier protein coac2 [Thalictrum thalictroides]|uniref:Mitochondrial carrier protein coac2 n=1 Tax=Thalictrum thalictroides TaxID=46969 RepID=A0A7J6V553_THATH|nr:Mitochondrial carrier protein coac2 [Thalictrum thalictroides]
MQTEARVGVIVEGGQSSLSDGTTRTFTTTTTTSSQPKQSQIDTVSHLLAGGVAGVVSKTCTAPLARLTILFQVQGMHTNVATMSKPSIWREASRIVGEEGFRAFWRGNLVTIAHRLPSSSITFYAYERYKRVFLCDYIIDLSLFPNFSQLVQLIPGLEGQRDNANADFSVRLLAGGLAGVTSASATYPLDLVRTRLAAQTNVIYYRGIAHALRTICRDEGFLSMYKGLGASLLGVGPNIAISFSVYETQRTSWQLRRPQDSTVLTDLLVQAQLTRQTTDLSSVSQDDFRNVLELAPRLLEELMKANQQASLFSSL